jgi:hypothetical protein
MGRYYLRSYREAKKVDREIRHSDDRANGPDVYGISRASYERIREGKFRPTRERIGSSFIVDGFILPEPFLTTWGVKEALAYCPKYQCENCGKFFGNTWEFDQEVDDLLERVSPGEIMPYGQCPDCGALVHATR